MKFVAVFLRNACEHLERNKFLFMKFVAVFHRNVCEHLERNKFLFYEIRGSVSPKRL
jgi:hypothetical protein